jgi:hypothetical protein
MMNRTLIATQLRLSGALGRDAHALVSPDGYAFLDLEIHQASTLAANVAAGCRKCYGYGATAQIAARSAAQHLRAGSRVIVHAAGWELRWSPSPHLWLVGVDLIEHQAVVPVRRALERESAT